mgnify:CR=1 FL=1
MKEIPKCTLNVEDVFTKQIAKFNYLGSNNGKFCELSGPSTFQINARSMTKQPQLTN